MCTGITEKIFQNMEVKFGKVFFSRVASYITGPQYGLTEMELLDVLSCDQQVEWLAIRVKAIES